MECRVICVGKRMPGWVDTAVTEFARRFSHPIRFEVITTGTAKRGRADNPSVYMDSEGKSLLSHVRDSDWVVALDVLGKMRSTEQLAQWLDQKLLDARPLVFLIGGPDGLSDECRARANEKWSLSELTLPHGLARVVVVEALYRANSLRCGHPYHRA
ncbi:MAG: 23S rRNA (pseudouridine(1915)-N(3))-methyltransferase RlmH [Gammaproteobacteria bacterium]